MTTNKVWSPTGEDLDRYRAVQQLAYRCAESVAAALEPGITEKAAARRMREWLVDSGVDDWFHVPFAWFGDRTAFRGFRSPLQFFPTNRQLVEGMPFILDCAPVVDGATADIGYSGSLGGNAVVDRILDDLADHRSLILDLARDRLPLREIYAAVDALATKQGYENRHRAYPFGVIAHQVGPLPKHPANVVVGAFGLRSLRALARSAMVGRAAGWSPLWSSSKRSNHPPTPGLWAVEPHLGEGDVAAKFEELLVVTDDDVFWLDDDLPHVRRWTQGTGKATTAEVTS